MAVRALWWSGDGLDLIDQRELPARTRIRHLRTLPQVAEAIRGMAVRGAPAIGAAAAYGMALAQRSRRMPPDRAARLLAATRPTARDLFVGIEVARAAWAAGGDALAAAEGYRRAIVEECHAIGRAGAPLLARKERVLTHCNAGALATVEWGTALAPIRVAHDEGRKLFVWVDETRPLLQGSRLTAWELAQERIPHAIIADNAAGYFMQRGEVDAIIVGADRIAANGDFANKIGTYEKAVLAREHGIPFYVAAPWSTFDPGTPRGDRIPVEERGPDEVLRLSGVATAPRRSRARNPAFDVTPHRFVRGFITPAGVLTSRQLGPALRAHARRAVDAPRRAAEQLT